MRAACRLVLLVLVISTSSYADPSTNAKRDKAIRELEACLQRGGGSTWACRHRNEAIKTLVDIYWQGDKTVLPALLKFTYLTDFYADALASDPEGFLLAVSCLSEPDQQAVASGVAGGLGGLPRARFDAIRATLTSVPKSSPNYELARTCLLTLEAENAAYVIDYFPPEQSGGPTANLAWWFSRDLHALRETPLWPPTQTNEHTYRVTVFPAFTFPRSVTLAVMPDQKGQITFRATDIQRRNPTAISETISSERVGDFTQTLERIQFWRLPANAPQLGFDGAYFILEGVQDGKYHIVARWCPGNTPFGEVVKDLFHFADPKFGGC